MGQFMSDFDDDLKYVSMSVASTFFKIFIQLSSVIQQWDINEN